MSKLSMERVKNVHLIGIGGAGMSAIAQILHQMGYQVSGSDIKESSTTIRLKDLGVKIFIGHDSSQVRFADRVVFSSAIAEQNPEIEEAKARGIAIYQRAEMLAWIMDQFPKRLAVAGTHGKTTTTSMLAHIFLNLGYDPTFLIGGQLNHGDENAHLGKGPLVVAEADESDRSFLCLNPNIEVITNIEADHLENFGTLQKVFDVFCEFVGKMEQGGHLFLCGDCENNRRLLSKISKGVTVKTYGLESGNLWQARNLRFSGGSSVFEVLREGKAVGEVFLSVPGWQNVLNALAAIAVGEWMGCELALLFSCLRAFQGAKRRFQFIGEVDQILVFDDYAHHPTEIKATLEAAKSGWPGHRIVCVFQPHRYTRTFFLRQEFGFAFEQADEVVITDIYSAGEMPIKNIDGEVIASEVQKRGKQKVSYIAKKEHIPDYLLSSLKPGDLVLTMGAGDIYTSGKELLVRLRMKGHEAGAN